MRMTVSELQDALNQLLEQGIVGPDYIMAFAHQSDGRGDLKCFPIDAKKIAAIDQFPGAPKMLVLTGDELVRDQDDDDERPKRG